MRLSYGVVVPSPIDGAYRIVAQCSAEKQGGSRGSAFLGLFCTIKFIDFLFGYVVYSEGAYNVSLFYGHYVVDIG